MENKMPGFDAPHWSWFHGCSKHQGQVAPCKLCIAARDPDITQDGAKAFGGPPPAAAEENCGWEFFYGGLATAVAKNSQKDTD